MEEIGLALPSGLPKNAGHTLTASGTMCSKLSLLREAPHA